MEAAVWTKDRLEDWVREQREAIVGLLTEMIAIPSENKPPFGNEEPMQCFLHERLNRLGFETELYNLMETEGLEAHPAYMAGRSYDGRPNLYAVQRGSGGGRSLLFSVHADVVPGVPGQTAVDPFQPVEQNGRLYGRGSNDMKGGIAAVLTALRFIREHSVSLSGDLAFESVVDEEMGGANGTLAGRIRGLCADAAIVPEPTNMRVCAAHLGGLTWRITLHGKGGMGFGGEEVRNPVYGMAHLVKAIERYQNEMQALKRFTTPTGEMLSPSVVLSAIHAGSFEPGMADGIPESCSIEVWVECLPGESMEELEQEFIGAIRTACAHPDMRGLTAEWETITRFLPGSRSDSPLTEIMLRHAEEEWGMPPGDYTAPFACDAFMFNLHSDTPAIIFGPVGENAHASDEFVDIDSLLTLTKIYIAAIMEWCGYSEGD